MRTLGWLTVVSICGAVSLVACSDDDSGEGTGGTAGTRDSGTDAREGGGSAGTSGAGGGGTATGGSAGTTAGSAGTTAGSGGNTGGTGGTATGGNAGMATGGSSGTAAGGAAGTAGGLVEAGADVGTGGTAETRDAAPDVTVAAPEPQPEGGAGVDSPISLPEAAVDAGIDAPDLVEATAPDAAPAEEAAAEGGDMVDAATDVAADAIVEAAGGSTVRYAFETGLEGWSTTAGELALATSTAQADTGGTQSLAVTMTAANYSSLQVNSPPPGLAAGTFTFRIYVPVTSTLTVVKPWTQTGAPNGYTWDGQDGLVIQPSGSWQTYTAQIASTYQVDGGSLPKTEPFNAMGFQLSGTGVIYIDNIAWQ